MVSLCWAGEATAKGMGFHLIDGFTPSLRVSGRACPQEPAFRVCGAGDGK